MDKSEAYSEVLADLRRDLAVINRERDELIRVIELFEARISGGAPKARTAQDVPTISETAEEILRSRGPLSNQDLFTAIRAKGIPVSNPNSMYATLHKKKQFARNGDKWALSP